MPLAAILESLEGKPEYYKDIYVEVEGKWVLDGDVENHPKATNLKATLDKERKAKKALEKEHEKFTSVDLERWAKLKDLEEEDLVAFSAWREEKDQNPNGHKTTATEDEFKQRLAVSTERLIKKHEQERAALLKENADLKVNIDRTTAQLHERTIKTALLNACSKAGIWPNAVEEAVLLGQQVFRLNDEGEVVAVGKDGNELLGADLKPLQPEEWLASKSADKAHWWPRNSGGGAGGGNGKGFDGIRSKADFHGDVEKQAAWMSKHPGKYLELPDK